MFKSGIALPAEPVTTELKCSTIKHRDLKRGAALFYAFGIATVAFVQHYSVEPSANATTTSTVVSSSASADPKQ